jgi:pimeloyl-ACP methyl ester carboxylesterase
MIVQIKFILALFFIPISETIQVPLDHADPESRKITIRYHFENQFDIRKETIFTIEDPIDEVYQNFELSNSIKSEFNWVRISGRYFSEDLEKFITENSQGNWDKIYHWLNQNQVAKDIELIRNQILGDGKVMLIGYSSSSASFLQYLSIYPNNVNKLVCINPLLLDIQTNLSFWSLSESFKNQSTLLSDAEFFDFAYQSSTDYFNIPESKRDSLISNSLKEFKEQKSDSILYSDHFPMSFAVRSFEHTLGLEQKGNSFDPISNYFREKSEPIWANYSQQKFPLIGINYDVGLSFKGEVMIIGGAYNLLINPKVADVLAEFFPKSTMIMFRDGHSLQKIWEEKDFSNLLLAFLKNDFNMKVKAYQSLADLNLLFLKKNYNSIQVD